MPRARRGPDTARVRWPRAFRVIASRFPPVQVFERLTGNPAAWDVLAALDDATNPRLRDAIGDIRLVPPARRVNPSRLARCAERELKPAATRA